MRARLEPKLRRLLNRVCPVTDSWTVWKFNDRVSARMLFRTSASGFPLCKVWDWIGEPDEGPEPGSRPLVWQLDGHAVEFVSGGTRYLAVRDGVASA